MLELVMVLVPLRYFMGYLGTDLFFFFFLTWAGFPKPQRTLLTRFPYHPNSVFYWFKQNTNVTTRIF